MAMATATGGALKAIRATTTAQFAKSLLTNTITATTITAHADTSHRNCCRSIPELRRHRHAMLANAQTSKTGTRKKPCTYNIRSTPSRAPIDNGLARPEFSFNTSAYVTATSDAETARAATTQRTTR